MCNLLSVHVSITIHTVRDTCSSHTLSKSTKDLRFRDPVPSSWETWAVPSGVPSETILQQKLIQNIEWVGLAWECVGQACSQYMHQFTLNGPSDTNLLKMLLLAKVWFLTNNYQQCLSRLGLNHAYYGVLRGTWPKQKRPYAFCEVKFQPN